MTDTMKPAPQPGWVATVTLELVTSNRYGAGHQAEVKFPNGNVYCIACDASWSLPWQPPPPPPWEPEIGGRAIWSCDQVTVLGFDDENAWIRFGDRTHATVYISDLSPPKGGEA